MQTKLTQKQLAIIPIAAHTAGGELDKLKISLEDGLDAGLTVNEIKEILVQMYAYAGFPRSLNGIATFIAVMDDRKAKALKMKRGKSPHPCPKTKPIWNSAPKTRPDWSVNR
nr:carboxymuconolactone decarboxylase family protein [uncultured Desulfobacter sp.]